VTVLQRPEVDQRDHHGFDAFYRTEVVSLATLAAALTGSRDTGADLAQEALLRAYRAWPTVSGYDRPGAWTRRVLLNLAADAHRRRSREQAALARLPSEQSVWGVPDPVDDPFWQAVRELPDRQQQAVVLRYVDDLSLDEIAHVLEVTSGTVKATLFAARNTLARRLHTEEVGDAHD
jgi:RNA polymerase sigma-70 factor (ECF subfamily)